VGVAEYTILALNGVLALVFGWVLSGRFAELSGGKGRPRWFLILLLVYFLESAAFAASMGTNFLGLALAFLWGSLLCLWQRRTHLGPAVTLRMAFRVALFTALPAVSFLSVPAVAALSGRPILSIQEGIDFGVPGFLPWPIATILGFCLTVVLVAVIGKAMITMGVVWLITHSRHEKDRRLIG
jgi:hypothetical protein